MIALAVVAAQYVGTFDATVSGRGDARVNEPATQITVGNRQEQIAIASDASFSAAALVHVRDRHWDFSLAYAPSITIPDLELQVDRDVQPSVDPTILNGGSAGIRWHDLHSWFSLTESGAYGRITTAVPYTGAPATPGAPQQTGMMQTSQGMPGMPPTPNPTPTQTTLFPQRDVLYGASSTGFAAGTTFGRRTTASLSGSYSLSGGLGDADTTVVPYQAGPAGTLLIATRMSPSEALFTTATGNYLYMNGECPLDLFPVAVQNAQAKVVEELPCATSSRTFQLEEGYRRQVGYRSMVSASVGLGSVDGPSLNGIYALAIVPVFDLSYTQELYTFWPGTLSVTVDVAPTASLLTTIVSDTATAVATLNARVTKLVTVAFTVNGVQSIPIPANDSPLTGVGGTVEARFRLNKQADVIVGDQEYWQSQVYGAVAGAPAQSFTSFTALAYVGVTLRAPTLHF